MKRLILMGIAAVLGWTLVGCGDRNADVQAQVDIQKAQKAAETPEDRANHD